MLKILSLATSVLLLLVAVLPANAQAALDEAVRRYKARDYTNALALLQGLIAKDQFHTDYHYYAALCYQQLGKLPEAAKEYQWVMSYSPDTTAKANARIAFDRINRFLSTAGSHAGSSMHDTSAPSSRNSSQGTSPQGTSLPTQAAGSAPSVRTDRLLFPTFSFKDGRSCEAGKAWCARLSNGQHLLISCLHLLGPSGGLDAQIPAEKVASLLESVEVEDVHGSAVGRTTTVLSKSGYTMVGDDCSGDVIFFRAPTSLSPGEAFTFAAQPAVVGQRCWLYTCLYGDTATKLYSGTVTRSSAVIMVVRLDNKVVTKGASGAPVIDQNGAVLGMMKGHYNESGDLICVPGSAIAGRIVSDAGR